MPITARGYLGTNHAALFWNTNVDHVAVFASNCRFWRVGLRARVGHAPSDEFIPASNTPWRQHVVVRILIALCIDDRQTGGLAILLVYVN